VILTIEIHDLRNTRGQVLLELMDDQENTIRGVSQKIVNEKCIIEIDSLSPGKYAFRYFHDENRDEEINVNWIGIPKEGFGFSNNAKGTFGPPSFEKMIFEIKDDTTLNCIPSYYR
jgi:uncharacterized protein (DUF2141 family)